MAISAQVKVILPPLQVCTVSVELSIWMMKSPESITPLSESYSKIAIATRLCSLTLF